MNEYIVDVEGNGLHPDKIHCLAYKGSEPNSPDPVGLTSYPDMRDFLSSVDTIIGHNIILWDIPVLERILDIEINARLIDTLALSWYLYPTLQKHGLDDWGRELGIEKPYIEDWHSLTLEEYLHRCKTDVKINHRLWHKLKGYLRILYPDPEDMEHLLSYLSFKLKCIRLQQKGWKLDLDRLKQNLEELSLEAQDRYEDLKAVMPKVPKTSVRNRPKVYYKKDGNLSEAAQRWEALCGSRGLSSDLDSVTVVTKYEEPNPNSSPQIKDWLFSLGWEPDVFGNNDVPQISRLDDKTELSDSVKDLIEVTPELKALEGYNLIKHRLKILEGFLDSNRDGYITADIAGFTNTLRFRHKTVVNLPGVDKPYGEYVRGVLVAPEGYELCGWDMSSLEDRTKQHWIYPYDPDYVHEMNKPDFDPHLDLAELAGAMTKDEVLSYKSGDHSKKKVRHTYKTTNYTCTYGAYPPKIAKTAGVSLEEGKKLFDTYWSRNWAIKTVAEQALKKTKTVGDQQWIFNPVSRIWYSLRNTKDAFSTLNQGTGSYCFDTMLAFVLDARPEVVGQFHDEAIHCIRAGYRKEMTQLLEDCIKKTNEALGLNRSLDIGIQFGNTYAEIH